MILYSLIAAAGDNPPPDPTQLPLWVAGPLAALVFMLFLTGMIIPGRTYNRLMNDYDKSRELTERVIPLAEKMVSSQDELAKGLERVTSVMEDLLVELARYSGNDPPPAPASRRRGPR